ncbi:MAG: nucleoside triphosphate pyrophosphohydrolase family protein [Rhodanobacter sp.]
MQYKTMTLAEYQQMCAAKAGPYPGRGNNSVTEIQYLVLGLAGEVGEIANSLKKALRDEGAEVYPLTPSRRAHLIDECGDSLWYLVQLTTALDINLSDVVAANRAKLEKRNPSGKGA